MQSKQPKITKIAKKGKKTFEQLWLPLPEVHDYPAAKDYLELHFSEQKCKTLITKLKDAPMTTKKAKDILRSSNLPLLPKSNIHVKHNLDKVKKGGKLSPVLIVSGVHTVDSRPLVADGYHRVCASYYLTEDLDIPCKLA